MIYDEEHYNQVLAVAKSYRNDVERLEKQLAEKEKEIEELHTQIEQIVKDYTSEIAFYTGTENQKAIEQLEKLQYTININQIDDGYTDEQVDLYELNETIDQQIKQLKEGK